MEQLAAHADLSWMLAAFVFVLLMFPGLAFYYGGMLGSRNVLNMMTMVLITLGITSVLYVVYGYGLVSGPSVNGWGLIGNPAEYIGLLNFQTDDGSGGTQVLYYAAWFILFAAITAAGIGLVFGLPSLRLKYLYLAVATLAFQVVFEWSVGHLPILAQGSAIALEPVQVFGVKATFFNHNLVWYYIILPVLVALALLWRNVLRTKHGRSLIAVRDNDRAAAAMGINPGTAKLTAFMIGSFYAGIAGGLFAYFQKAVVIEDYTLHTSVQLLAMAIVGGLGSLPGSFLGPLFIVALDRVMGGLSGWISEKQLFPQGVDAATALRPLAFGLSIVLFLMFEPRGLANWWRLVRLYFKKWPYKF